MDDLNSSKVVGVDCNLMPETLDYITRECRAPLFLDPVSVSKADRVKPMIGRFHTIKPNRIEAELLSGIKITDDTSLASAGDWFCHQGVKRVFISLGENGAYYKSEGEEGIVGTKPVRLLSATGAGDAFSAAILMGHVMGLTAKETAQMASPAHLLPWRLKLR